MARRKFKIGDHVSALVGIEGKGTCLVPAIVTAVDAEYVTVKTTESPEPSRYQIASGYVDYPMADTLATWVAYGHYAKLEASS